MRIPLVLVVLGVVLLASVSPAAATSVAYLDGNEVWVATVDGQTRVRLSAGEGDWLAVAQGDGGQVVGVRNEPGRNGSFATFAVWQPDGTLSDQGPLQSRTGYSISVLPVGLDITPDGRSMVYGFSQSRYDSSTFPATFVLDVGTVVQSVAVRAGGVPFAVDDQAWPTLAGSRVVGAYQSQQVWVQDPTGQPPYSFDFTPWLGVPNPFQVRRTDVAASGSVAAMELYEPNPGSGDDLQERIAMFPLSGLGGTISPADHDCFLPTDGKAHEPSLSQDGRLVAYVDQGGVKVAPVTDFAALVTDCAPTTPTTISATGRKPSLGPLDVAALAAARNPPSPVPPPTPVTPGKPPTPSVPGGNAGDPAPVVSIPSKTKASSLAAGVAVSVKVPRAGTVSLSLLASSKVLGLKGRARSVVVATGAAKAKRAGKVSVKLAAKRAYRRKLGKLKGKKLTLRTTFAGRTTTKTITLR